MSTIDKYEKNCYIFKYFGCKATLKGNMVEYANTSHACKIGAKCVGNINPTMSSACSNWKPRTH